MYVGDELATKHSMVTGRAPGCGAAIFFSVCLDIYNNCPCYIYDGWLLGGLGTQVGGYDGDEC